MRKPLALVSALLLAIVLPAPAAAWGFTGHQYIMRRAIDLLPPELKPFFTEHREVVILRVIDPDLWRNVGWKDDPHHFLDFGVSEYGAYPFAALPRDYDAALEKFGRETLERNGLLPWRASEMFGHLRRAFEGFARASAYAVSDATLFSAVTSHYIQDAHQPLHATINYDGQQTGQHGVHARFERDLFERFESRLDIHPAAPAAVVDIREFAFTTLVGSYQFVEPLLAADREAAAGKDVYDDDYFEKFFVRVKPLLEERVSASITSTAGLLIGAWEAAGRPALRLRDARPLQKVRPAK
jgi:hypothetical protein